MGVVEEFANSGDVGWDVSRGHFLVHMIDELPNHTDVVLVVNGKRIMLYNKNFVRVKVVDEKKNGNPSEIE